MRRILEAAVAAAAVGLLLYLPERDDGSGAVAGGLAALVGVFLALSVMATVRSLPKRSVSGHVRLLTLALGIGLAVGVANLSVNYAMAVLDDTIRSQMTTRWAEFSAWSVVITGPIMEEIAYRLVLLSGLAWIVARFTSDRRRIFPLALAGSALLFGVAHIFYGGVDAPLYAVGMALKSVAGGVVFGWIFWRWGLPYSIASHCTANGIHLLLMPLLF